MPSDAIERARDTLSERRRELVDELREIDQALTSLGRDRRRRPGRPRSSTPRRRTGTRRARRGGRRDQAVKLISEHPGISASELAKKMRLRAPNYLYRVLPDLVREGAIAKEGRGYKVKA
jgi:hypothetical protein